MKKRSNIPLIVFITLVVLFVFACTNEKEFTYLNDQIVAINKRVTRLEKTVDAQLKGNLDAKLKSVNTRQAEVGAEINNLKSDLQELSGRIEESEHIIKRTRQMDLTSQDVIRKELASLAPKLKELEEIVKRHQAYIDQKPKKTVTNTASGELELYDLSYALFKEKKFEQALASFKRFLDEYPNSDRADNAQFWIGESLAGLKQYRDAIMAYNQVVKKYPKGNKVPSALLRQGMTFLEINEPTGAKACFNKIIREFPESEEASKAQAKLKAVE